MVTYNSEPLVADLIASLPSGLDGADWSLTVVDSASTDGVVARVKELAPHATVVETGRNGGYAAGINAGVAAAPPHSAVLVLNPDVRLSPGCVRGLLSALREPAVGIAVPKLLDADGELIESQRRRAHGAPGVRGRRARSHSRWPVPLARRGGHRPSSIRVSEEHGLGRRLDNADKHRVLAALRTMGRVLLPLLSRRPSSRFAPTTPASSLASCRPRPPCTWRAVPAPRLDCGRSSCSIESGCSADVTAWCTPCHSGPLWFCANPPAPCWARGPAGPRCALCSARGVSVRSRDRSRSAAADRGYVSAVA